MNGQALIFVITLGDIPRMRGKRIEGAVVGYIPSQRSGRIKGDDGVQYTFDLADIDDSRLVSRIQSRKGQELREPVKFVVDGYRAKAIKPSETSGSASAQSSPFSLRLPDDLTQRQAFGAISSSRGTGVYHEAKAAVERGQPEQAVALFREAIKAKDNTLSAVKDLASAYLMVGQSTRAIKLLKDYIASGDLPIEEFQKFHNLLENAQSKAAKERRNAMNSSAELQYGGRAEARIEEPTRLAAKLAKHLDALPLVTTAPRQTEEEDDTAELLGRQFLERAGFKRNKIVDDSTDELSGRHFLGTIESLPTGTSSGKIRAHYELSREIQTGSWRLDDGDGFKDLGPSLLAEWQVQAGGLELPIGTLVHFVVAGRTSNYGAISDTAPWYAVKPQIERLGALIIPTPENFWTEAERRVPYQDPNLTFYCMGSGTLTGPWRVAPDLAGGTLVPLSPDGTVREILVEDLEPEMIVEVKGLEYLLPCPSVPVARMVDVRASAELTEWLISTLSSQAGELIERLDESHPRWRDDLQSSINILSDPQERTIFLARWQRVEPIVEALSSQNELFQRLLNENATLSSLLKTNLRHALDQARSDIFRQAETEAAELLEGEKAELIRLQEEVRQLSLRAEALRAAPLALDSYAVPVTLEPGSLHPAAFVKALEARMRSRLPEVGADDAALLHLTSLVCRCVLVPSCAWSQSYFEAFSAGAADFTNLAVSPTWLNIEDVWKGGFSTPWQQALENPNKVYLVHFTRFNHSMLDCWGPAVLLSSADLSTQLPGLSPSAWPKNLRTFWSPALSSGPFPSSMDLVGAFAAVIPSSEGSSVTTSDTPEPSDLQGASASWLATVPATDKAAGTLAPAAKGLREFARRATDDIAGLVQAGNSLGWPLREEKAAALRIAWPREVFSMFEAEGTRHVSMS